MKRTAVLIATVVPLLTLIVGFLMLRNIASLTHSGQRVNARVVSAHSPERGTRHTNLRLEYLFKGRTYTMSAEEDSPVEIPEGSYVSVLVDPAYPDSAWYGSLDQRDYDVRLRAIILIISAALFLGIVIFVGNESEMRQDLRRLTTWPATLATLESLEMGGMGGTSFKVTYDLNGRPYSSDVRTVVRLKLSEPIEILVDPDNPEKVILPSEIRLAELSGGI